MEDAQGGDESGGEPATGCDRTLMLDLFTFHLH
uniref:Uncharacterized protein n=1 Tax=Nymphaea colorata TaxID=210225 RepID=A0A5K0W160_9MAGN